ncbi:hypothetical protein [Nannocystis pusilla]|uniref:hypothetical protein n=1 Tax=Nannocystis pusilla TaxID=889268 RepID=UPI0023EF2B85|nr:hypothetical protein [Nannocystis pusilla]
MAVVLALALGPSEQLERDLAIEAGIEGGVDDAHAAGAEPLEDDVAPEQLAALERSVRVERLRRDRVVGDRGARQRERIGVGPVLHQRGSISRRPPLGAGGFARPRSRGQTPSAGGVRPRRPGVR